MGSRYAPAHPTRFRLLSPATLSLGGWLRSVVIPSPSQTGTRYPHPLSALKPAFTQPSSAALPEAEPPATPCALPPVASVGLSPSVRAHRFRWTATALPRCRGLGSPTADQRPLGRFERFAPDHRKRSSPRDPPCDHDTGGTYSLRSWAQPAAPTPSALKGTNHKTYLFLPLTSPALQREHHQYEYYK